MQTLVLNDFGTYLGKRSERAVVKHPDGTEEEFPLFRLSEIIVAKRGVSLSADLIAAAVQRDIQIHFLDFKGEPFAALCSPFLTAVAATRRAQLAAYHDARGVLFSKTIVAGKLHNQAHLLKYASKYLKETDRERYEAVLACVKKIESGRKKAQEIQGDSISEVRGELLGLEGNAGKAYWQGVAVLLKEGTFQKREHRGATDVVNSLLNYGYGILYSKIWAALLTAGLEPFCGFLHVDRPGKPSLVLDCIEEFRQPVVDRVVFSLINKGARVKTADGLLTASSRKLLAERVLNELEKEVAFESKRYKLKSVLQMQARHVATFFREEHPYKCYRFRW